MIFVKAPSPGEVKTRMIPTLSPEAAAHLYRSLVFDTLEAARQLRNVHVVVSYAANPSFPDVSWMASSHGTPMMCLQHGRTLGERLMRAFQWAFEQRAQHVAVMGSDAPDLQPQWRPFFHFAPLQFPQ